MLSSDKVPLLKIFFVLSSSQRMGCVPSKSTLLKRTDEKENLKQEPADVFSAKSTARRRSRSERGATTTTTTTKNAGEKKRRRKIRETTTEKKKRKTREKQSTATGNRSRGRF